MKFDIMKAFNMIAKAVPVLVTIIVSVLVGIIVTGVLVYQTTNGNIDMSSDANTSLSTTASSMTDWWTTVTSAGTTTVGLIVLVVVLIIFAGFLSFGKGKGENY